MHIATSAPPTRATHPLGGAAPPIEAPRGPSVLVVEDEPAIRLLLCDLLEDAGMNVEGAGDAESALGLLSARTDEGNRHKVLVTDVNLGRGLDGIALASLARKRAPCIRVVFVTGNPERVLKRGAGPPPREHVVGKPFANADLVATVRGLAAAPDTRC